MDLHAFQEQLAKQLLQNPNIEIKKQMQYSIPVHTLEVSYHPVVRNAMDILMKMMLLSFQKAKLQSAAILADILLVEPLFIHDLTNKMLHLQMIEKEEYFTLTAKGLAQLQSGIFEEELPLVSRQLQYSALHKDILQGDIEALLDIEQFPDSFPYMESEEIGELEESKLIEQLQALEQSNELAEDEVQTFITSIHGTESIQINDVPLLCFVLYDLTEERHDIQVYNTLTNEWDAQVASVLFTHEKENWQKS
ncbi:nucleoside-diphosphate sugar epimerase [Solibacillus sp. R5-41]|uniref:nucleoside-diphosphate sugar epimerase n=1 Tax=Solibacillus sp. R5-41 TaxID=2048654 RepID=UPI000C126583|nr:nucleoside-diphosphate sugar epimerase [Solibacillus sp. R5-41]ATP40306.1 nucleoside-diphosphate sugar epimerase [Solibacillus sp. R5-41]